MLNLKFIAALLRLFFCTDTTVCAYLHLLWRIIWFCRINCLYYFNLYFALSVVGVFYPFG